VLPLHTSPDFPAKLAETGNDLQIGVRSIFVGLPLTQESTQLQLCDSPIHQQVGFASLTIDLTMSITSAPACSKKSTTYVGTRVRPFSNINWDRSPSVLT
jgi:hypothetical protein